MIGYSAAGKDPFFLSVEFKGGSSVTVDFDKEYRSNMYAKYSNIRSFVNILRKSNQKSVLKIHYVDDNIISGKRACISSGKGAVNTSGFFVTGWVKRSR